MKTFEGLLFGLLQGITEFLPVSSSGHLFLLKYFFRLQEVPVLFDITLHIATLLAVIIIFRNRLWALVVLAFRLCIGKTQKDDKPALKYLLAIIIASAITAFLGLGIEKVFPAFSIKVVSACFLCTALFLVLGNYINNGMVKQRGLSGSGEIRVLDGVIVGIAQGLGVLPGISRSGITISAGLCSGLKREAAGEFSFIISIPAIAGAFILELRNADTLIDKVEMLPLLAGFIAAFVSGLLALKVLMSLVKRARLHWFAFWLVPLGLAGLFIL
jgi:undecaprenyl-diphosphatase